VMSCARCSTTLHLTGKLDFEDRVGAYFYEGLAIGREACSISRSKGSKQARKPNMPKRARTVPRREPRQQRAEETIAVLVEATERVVSRDGFHAATTNAIAKVAGVSIGTLYHYFPTKEALVSAVVHRMWEAELTAVMRHADAFETEPLAVAIRRAVTAL